MISLETPLTARTKLAKVFKLTRGNFGYTQQQLSQKSGVALATLRKFERTGLISLESFLKLALVLGVLDKLVSAIESPPKYQSLDEIIAKGES